MCWTTQYKCAYPGTYKRIELVHDILTLGTFVKEILRSDCFHADGGRKYSSNYSPILLPVL